MNGLHLRIHSLAQAPVLLDSDLGGRTVEKNNDGMNLQGQQSSTTTTTAGTTKALSSPFSPPLSTTRGATPTGDFDIFQQYWFINN